MSIIERSHDVQKGVRYVLCVITAESVWLAVFDLEGAAPACILI